MSYRRRCSWCGADLGEAPADIQPPGDTHGICERCARGLLLEAGVCMGCGDDVEPGAAVCRSCKRPDVELAS